MKKTNKKIPIFIGVIALVIIAVVAAVVIMNRGHRVIKVESFDGEVVLERDASIVDIFEDMNLKSGDMVTTGGASVIALLADEDKHIAATENTCFTIVSNGNATKGTLKIELQYGTSLIEIENKLPEGASFEVETPNAALGVRGTIFEVTYIPETNTTILKVTDGAVQVDTNVETGMVNAGEMAIITDTHIEISDIGAGYGDASGVTGPDVSTETVTSGQPIGEEEWPDLLKGGSNFYQLEYLLEIASLCEYEGNADYIKTALYWMSYKTYSSNPYEPIAVNPDTGETTYDVATLNNLYSFLTDEQINEEHLNSTNRLEGDRLICTYVPTDFEISTSAGITYSYYDDENSIIVEYFFNVIHHDTGEIESFTKEAHLIPDEEGKYVLDYIE